MNTLSKYQVVTERLVIDNVANGDSSPVQFILHIMCAFADRKAAFNYARQCDEHYGSGKYTPYTVRVNPMHVAAEAMCDIKIC